MSFWHAVTLHFIASISHFTFALRALPCCCVPSPSLRSAASRSPSWPASSWPRRQAWHSPNSGICTSRQPCCSAEVVWRIERLRRTFCRLGRTIVCCLACSIVDDLVSCSVFRCLKEGSSARVLVRRGSGGCRAGGRRASRRRASRRRALWRCLQASEAIGKTHSSREMYLFHGEGKLLGLGALISRCAWERDSVSILLAPVLTPVSASCRCSRRWPCFQR